MLSKINYTTLVKFSVPSVLAALVEPLASVVDTSLVGRFSTDMLAAMAICTVIFNSLSWMFNFLIHTSTQKVADFNAQSNEKLLAQRISISFLLALLVSIFAVLIMLIFKDQLYFIAGAKESQVGLADDYYLTRIYGHIFSILFMTMLAIIRGLGFVKEAFFVTIIGTIINITLSALLLYEYKLGLKGIAFGTVFSHFISTLICILILKFKKKGLLGKIFSAKPDRGEWVHFGKNSLNVFGRSLTLTSCFFIATRYSSLLGKNTLAAHQILLQLWLFCSFFIDGLASSANILLSYYYSKKDFGTSRAIVSMFVKMTASLGVFFTLTYLIFAREIISLFTYDEDVIYLCLMVMPIIYSSQIISCLAFIFDGIMFGLEKFNYLRKHMIFAGLFVFLPVSSISLYRESFVYIWIALVVLNIYRVLTNFYLTRSELAIEK